MVLSIRIPLDVVILEFCLSSKPDVIRIRQRSAYSWIKWVSLSDRPLLCLHTQSHRIVTGRAAESLNRNRLQYAFAMDHCHCRTDHRFLVD